MAAFFRRRDGAGTDSRLRHALDDLRPLLAIESVAIELETWDAVSGIARVRLRGDCPDCDMRVTHLVTGIEARLRQAVPELRAVEFVDEAGGGGGDG